MEILQPLLPSVPIGAAAAIVLGFAIDFAVIGRLKRARCAIPIRISADPRRWEL